MPTEQRYPQQQGFDFDRFLSEQRKPLERFIGSRIGGMHGDYEDLASEIMTTFLVYCRQYPERITHPRGLLFKIARNRILAYYEERRRKYREIPIEDAPQIPSPGSIPAAIDASDELRTVREALSTIREEYREVITLHAMVGLSASEIADMMEKPAAHVRVLLFRARRSLRKALRKQRPEVYGSEKMDQSRDQ